MSTSKQKDQSKAGKSFDVGSINALPNVEFSSGIFEAPGIIQPEVQVKQSRKPSGGQLDKLAATSAGKTNTGQSKTSTDETHKVISSDGSIVRKPKDTAGAGAMIL
ncbi:hypothetical protein F4804DRAFT_337302 [Jackrogersella minutella]|nr:hypothetical protein F4804DRAFT_337302 [Jackrogersella minutella]